MIAALSRVILDTLFGVAMRERIERVAGLVFLTLLVGLFLAMGVAFGDVRVIALMAVVGALLGLYLFRERLHVSTTVVRVVLIAVIALLFLGLRLFVAPTGGGS
jgi:hypothetical protein